MPIFCLACLARFRALCPHLHRSFPGGFHFTNGDIWDDLTEVCDDCGADLDALPKEQNPCPI